MVPQEKLEAALRETNRLLPMATKAVKAQADRDRAVQRQRVAEEAR